MTWILGILIGILVLDAVRMRGRLTALRTVGVDGDGESAAPGFTVAVAPGTSADSEVVQRVAAFARAEGLDVVDVVPGRLPTVRALALAMSADPRSYRAARFAPGRTVGHALVMSPEVRRRLPGAVDTEPADPVGFVRLASELKRYACTTTDFAVVPGVAAAPEQLGRRRAVMREVVGGATPFVLGAQLAVYALLVLGVALPGARLAGAIALAAFHLQPAIALVGSPLRPRDLPLMLVARLPVELWVWTRTLVGRWRPADAPDPVEQRRDTYRALLAGDPSRLFEPRRDTCPLCDGRALGVHLQTTDLLQQKPGRFTLERCDDCGHIFQNPRLSIEGLDFYYKDFYDGLGERGMEFIFGHTTQQYEDRARMLDGIARPARWLDVGGGHGHFCCAARDVWPETRFDALDLSEAVGEAERRGWVDTGYRGLFPELAPGLSSTYDVVSMGHYLEHTLDPEAELEAARTALAPGGHLLIEVPDPDSALGRVLGRYWIPWFQPQHQHLLSTRNLELLLDRHGFEPVTWHRARAHQRVDFLFAVVLLLDRLAPPTDRPWRARASRAARMWRALVWTAGTPLLVAARVIDVLGAPVVRRLGMSNTYRVLARRSGELAAH